MAGSWTLTPVAKTGIVVAGYVAAVLIAWSVVAVHIAATEADRQGSDGMYGFGDSLFFLWAFGLAAVPATGAWLYFLRPHARFWAVLAVSALMIAATSVVALILYLSPFEPWSDFSVLRILVAPVCALSFLVGALFAPGWPVRFALLAATAIEGGIFGIAIVVLLSR